MIQRLTDCGRSGRSLGWDWRARRLVQKCQHRAPSSRRRQIKGVHILVNYLVKWEIDTEDGCKEGDLADPRLAAIEARRAQLRPDSTATTFYVIYSEYGARYSDAFDLDEGDQTTVPKQLTRAECEYLLSMVKSCVCTLASQDTKTAEQCCVKLQALLNM